MAAIAEETEQERADRLTREAQAERLRLFEEEALAAQLPQEAIPAENVAFINGANGQIQIDVPEGFTPPFNRQMIGDERYNQEVARARAGSGFIAGYGDTQTYDPAIAEAAQRREQDKLAAQAERFNGVAGYQQSLRSGAAPAEALALWGQKMFRGDPGGYASLVTRREPVARVAPLQKFVPGRVPPSVRAAEDNLKDEITSMRRQLTTTGLGGLPIDPAEADALKAQISSKEQQRVQLLDRPEYSPNVDQEGWRNMRDRWERPSVQATAPAKQAAAPVKASDEQVVVTKDGQPSFLPKSQLPDALKAGYKQISEEEGRKQLREARSK